MAASRAEEFLALSTAVNKELKVQKFKTAVYKAGSGIALIMTVLFLVK
jgi:hypothetical protein